VIRVTDTERQALEARCPKDADLSTWMRSTCLQVLCPASKTKARPRPKPAPLPDAASLLRARALMSLAQSMSEILQNGTAENPQDLTQILDEVLAALLEA